MERYVQFLNELHQSGEIDFDQLEAFWISKVREFLSRKGLVLRYDASRTIRAALEDLISQAKAFQRESGGTMYAGSMLHYLVGAKLRVCLGMAVEVRGASAADASSGTGCDFEIGDTAIHVTTSPGEAVLRKCAENLTSGLRPMIVTLPDRLAAAKENAGIVGIQERVEIVDGPQFLAMNLYEKSGFAVANDRAVLGELMNAYNELVREHESDPRLLIRFGE